MATRATTGGGEATARSQPHTAGHNDAAAARRWPRHHPPRRSPGARLTDPVVVETGTTELGWSRSTDTLRERRRKRGGWKERNERSLDLQREGKRWPEEGDQGGGGGGHTDGDGVGCGFCRPVGRNN
jgi:hypothetical protein